MTVIRHDRKPANLTIHNLVPIFTLQQLQSYFIYRLEMIEGEKFRVAVSKYPDKYTLDKYLVGNRGTIFALHKKVFMKSSSGRYAMYLTYPTFKADNGGNTRYIQGHILVAATFVGPIPPDYHVHHIDGHPRSNEASKRRTMEQTPELRHLKVKRIEWVINPPDISKGTSWWLPPSLKKEIPPNHHVHHINGHSRDNKASNLLILPASEHWKLHSNNYQKRNKDTDITKTCTICLEQDQESVWCHCQRSYCKTHITAHEESC